MAKTKTVSKKAATTTGPAAVAVQPNAAVQTVAGMLAETETLRQRVRALETENRLLSDQVARLTRGRPE